MSYEPSAHTGGGFATDPNADTQRAPLFDVEGGEGAPPRRAKTSERGHAPSAPNPPPRRTLLTRLPAPPNARQAARQTTRPRNRTSRTWRRRRPTVISTTTTTTAPRRSSFATTRTTRTGPFDDSENLLEGTGLSAWVAPSPGLRRRGGSAGVPRRATRGGGHDQRAAKRAEIESFEYYPGDSAVYREWLGKQPIHRNYDRWPSSSLSDSPSDSWPACCTPSCTPSAISSTPPSATLNRRQVFLAWLFNTVYSSALAFAATDPVAHIRARSRGQRRPRGDGVPERV